MLADIVITQGLLIFIILVLVIILLLKWIIR